MITLTCSQLKACDAVRNGKNVVVDAVPGGGKTTLIQALIEQNPEKRVLVLMYNKLLQLETKEKIQHLKNATAMTFHGAVGNMFNVPGVNNDHKIQEILSSGTSMTSQKWDIIIVDEAQDLCEVSHTFLKRLFAANPSAQIVILGCTRQCLFSFRKEYPADARYLRFAPILYDHVQWEPTIQFCESQRLTPNIAKFANFLWRDDHIIGKNSRNNLPVVYIVDIIKSGRVVNLIKQKIDTFGVNNVVILAHSVQKKMPASWLAKYFKKKFPDIPIFRQDRDTHENNPQEMQNKLRFMTFCSTKGLEFSCVIILLDDYFGKSILSDAESVALTRCCGGDLTVIQNHNNGVVTGRSLEELEEAMCEGIEIKRNQNEISVSTKAKEPRKRISVTEICKRIPEQRLMSMIKQEPQDEKKALPRTPNLWHDKRTDTYENVAKLIGIALPLAYYCKCDYKKIFGPLNSDLWNEHKNEKMRYNSIVAQGKDWKPSELAFLFLCHEIDVSGGHDMFLLNQLPPDIEWLPETLLIESTTLFKQIGLKNQETDVDCDNVSGRVDGFTSNDDAIVELKYTDQLTYNHMIQTVLYYCLREKSQPNYALLYNYKTGENIRLTCADRSQFLKIALEEHARIAEAPSDQEFIAKNTMNLFNDAARALITHQWQYPIENRIARWPLNAKQQEGFTLYYCNEPFQFYGRLIELYAQGCFNLDIVFELVWTSQLAIKIFNATLNDLKQLGKANEYKLWLKSETGSTNHDSALLTPTDFMNNCVQQNNLLSFQPPMKKAKH